MIFNWLGMGVYLGSAAFGYAVQSVVGQVGTTNTVANLVGFVVSSIVDAVYRWKNNCSQGAKRFVLPSTGGHVSFIPLWVLACAGIVYRLMESTVGQ